MRRLGPRPLSLPAEAVRRQAAPQTLLARVQGCWAEVAGPAVAAEAYPQAESQGVVTVGCRSSVWAHELELLGSDLRARLNAALGPHAGPPPVRRIRFVTGPARAEG